MKTHNNKKKGEISTETIVMVVIGLAVLLVVIGIFTFQARKGSGTVNQVGDAATNQSEQGMCLGTGYSCKSACDATNEIQDKTGKTCLMPGLVCCKKK